MVGKTLFIITGPPGAGKTTYAQNHFPHLKVYDRDLGNKDKWRDSRVDCILMTSAPSARKKDYWLSEATREGFSPRILVIMPPRLTSLERMLNRPANNGLTKQVEQWYQLYSKHPLESRIEE